MLYLLELLPTRMVPLKTREQFCALVFPFLNLYYSKIESTQNFLSFRVYSQASQRLYYKQKPCQLISQMVQCFQSLLSNSAIFTAPLPISVFYFFTTRNISSSLMEYMLTTSSPHSTPHNSPTSTLPFLDSFTPHHPIKD